MKFLRQLFFLSAAFIISTSGSAQEYVRELATNPIQHFNHEKPKSHAPQTRATLPFIDDFSTSYITPDPTKWVGTQTYINGTYPFEPPTIGVATFDGLMSNGMPYNLNGNFSPHGADTLTSQTIDLSSVSPADSVYLSFFYEPQGLGDYPNSGDSIILEFRQGIFDWIKIWSQDGFINEPNDIIFKQVMIPITDAVYFNSDFQFRFRNKAAINGNNDHWHIDYVKLDKDRSAADTVLNDEAIQYPPIGPLKTYRQIPWNQFQANAVNELAPELELKSRNNYNITKNTTYGYTSEELISGNNLGNPPLVSFNFNSLTNQTLTLPSIDVSSIVIQDSAIIKTTYFSYITGSGDVLADNDTVIHYQHFRNELAYDDGSAEKAYGLNGIGAQGALRFHVNTPDTLRAIRILWTHISTNQSNLLVTLRVWHNLSDPLLYESGFSNIVYVDTMNGFATYVLDNPVAVTDSFYIGWIQDNNTIRDMGLDKNTNALASDFRYNIGNGWLHSQNTGTPMMRPVLGSGDGIYNTGIATKSFDDWNVYPNPVIDYVKVYGANESVYELMDVTGRMITDGVITNERIDLPNLSPGLFLLRVSNNELMRTFKLVKP